MKQFILLAAFAGLFGYGYMQENSNVTPDKIEVVNEVFPTAPDPRSQQILALLDTVVTDPADAIIFARACRDFAEVVSRDSFITTLAQFDAVRVNAFQSLLLKTNIQGKYGGGISTVMKALYDDYFAYLKTPEGVTSTNVGPKERELCVKFYNALSWKFHQIALNAPACDPIKGCPL